MLLFPLAHPQSVGSAPASRAAQCHVAETLATIYLCLALAAILVSFDDFSCSQPCQVNPNQSGNRVGHAQMAATGLFIESQACVVM